MAGGVGTLGYPSPCHDLAGGVPTLVEGEGRYLGVHLHPIMTWPGYLPWPGGGVLNLVGVGTPLPHLDLAGVPLPSVN